MAEISGAGLECDRFTGREGSSPLSGEVSFVQLFVLQRRLLYQRKILVSKIPINSLVFIPNI